MRFALLLILALAAGAVHGQAKVYERGEFRFSVGPAPAFVQEQAVPTQWPGTIGSDDDRWRNWLVDRQADRRPDQQVVYIDRVYEPVSPELVQEAAKFNVSFNPLYQTLTLHRVEVRRDGQWSNRLDAAKVSLARRESDFEQNMSDGMVTALLVLDDVRVHDLVRLTYSVKGSNPILAGDLADDFVLGWGDPILARHGLVVFPPATPLVVRAHGTDVRPSEKKLPDRIEWSFSAEGIGAIRNLGLYPNWFSPYPHLEVAPKRSWGDVVQWALPLYPPDVTLPADLEARLKQWQALGDPYQQAGAALRAVQEDVRYFGVEMGDNSHQPHAPSETWGRRYGDCKDKAYLLTVLLRRLGLQAEPALVSTSDGRAIADGLPAASVFNHVIVRWRLGAETFWLDATLTQQRGDLRQIDLYDYGMALPILPGSQALVEVKAPSAIKNELSVVERFVPRADGKADLYVQTNYRGDRAESVRRRLRRERFDQMTRGFADYYRKRYGDLSVASAPTSKEDEVANTVALTEHYLLDDPWGKSSGNSRLLPTYAQAMAADLRLPDSMSRVEPMALSGPVDVRHEIRIDLPEGWVLSSQEGSQAITSGATRYSRQLTMDGRSVSLVHQLKLEGSYVDATQVTGYLAKLREINDDLGADLLLGRPVPSHSSERDLRLKNLLQDVMQEPAKAKEP